MGYLTSLVEDTGVDNNSFWKRLRAAVIEAGSELDLENAALHGLITEPRCNDTSRLDSMTTDELVWLQRRWKQDKPIKVYRTAPQGLVAGFRFHTNIQHAIDEASAFADLKPHLVVGHVEPKRVLMRIEAGGRKLLVVFPQFVKVQRVDAMKAMRVYDEAA